MLKTLDILIGISLIMLMLSLVVTVITQGLLHLRQSRGKELLKGLADLLGQLDPKLESHANEIAGKVLAHPLLRESEKRLGTVVRRDEFTRVLMELASKPTKNQAEQALADVLKTHGVTDPAGTLANIRELLVTLERSNPELSTSVRHNLAILHATADQLVGKVNAWFDQTMDRVADRFTASARIWTVAGSVLVVLVTQADTITMLNRLAMDDAMRQGLVREAVNLTKQQPPPTGTADQQATEQYYRVLSEAGVLSMPSVQQWVENWAKVNIAGLVITVLLLSLGAPFWYKVLSSMVRLRSALAQKDDAERNERDTSQPMPATPLSLGSRPAALPASSAPVLAGERGDLVAVG